MAAASTIATIIVAIMNIRLTKRLTPELKIDIKLAKKEHAFELASAGCWICLLYTSEQGYATAGHNGPHGHLDTPVRNTAHYLIIYSYLFKETGDEKYQRICERFVDYLCQMQSKSQSGAIQCMVSDKFDHLNGLIGQGWVIEGLLYYFEIFGDTRSMDVAKKIYCAQKYDSVSHLWHRIELDGTDIGIDPTYNHQVWFAACSCKLAVYDKTLNVDESIRDFLTAGASRDFRAVSYTHLVS